MTTNLDAMYAIYQRYEEQLKPTALPKSYGTVIAGIRSSTPIPPYTVSYGPFYAGTAEITAFATAVTNLKKATSAITGDVNEIVTEMTSVPEFNGFPLPSFNINSIVDLNFDISFSILDASSGLCGLTSNLPTTILGAVMNVVNQIIKGLVTKIINTLDSINQMFGVPTRMINGIKSFIDDTQEKINEPLLKERNILMNTLKDYRKDLKISNNPLQIEFINQQLNKIGMLDRKIRTITLLLRKLEDDTAAFLIHLDNTMRLGTALVANIQNIVKGWQKDAVCIQTAFSALIKVVT